ncbi:MAG: DUF2442 domain-containing protein [Caldilineaceae bacterium]|nr:DUF2442 domain-containing protein [Caldilineaceae bacterium]MBP8108631.1 DUF2442 domain-containing protein [Caldilineaceae bacterium]MBP8123184.1 DUF2442 domain-containing protein [Caldilineaceae bacterium]MBP9072406.1 DUF2442 domain-containing protein [Caldilineaceae bacterium]
MISEFGTYFDVTALRILKDFVLWLRFSDGSERTINFLPVLNGPIFGPLTDPNLFRQVRLNSDTGTIEWPNGADFNPTILHDWPDYEERLTRKAKGHVLVNA